MDLSELSAIHKARRSEIQRRLAEFYDVGQNASDERLFEELTFCIFTAGASARMGLRSIDRIRGCLLNGSLSQLRRALTSAHRFPRARAAYVYRTRHYLKEICELKMRELLIRLDDAEARRDYFARNPAVVGIGYKEASHFLRNIGFRGYAILDKHVLTSLAELGVIESPKPPATKARYEAIESRMKRFAESVEIDFDELDLLLWFTRTGEILK